MPLIQIRGLTKYYRMGDSVVHALDNVDLDIEAGEFIAITGASGSGKSTMMHLLGCLDRPTRGSYILDGKNVSDLSDGDLAIVRNKKIGFVFQTFNLINRTSALENVGVPLFYARKANTRTPARKALERVGLAHRAHHRPNELSGGERQRVAIARAIVNDPLLVLADEPTGNLDSRTGEQIMEVFHGLNAQGVTIILVTHEPDVAQQARRVVQMKDGRILSDRLAEQIRRPPPPPEPDHGATAAGPLGGTPGAVTDKPNAPALVARDIAAGATVEKRMARGATSALTCAVLGPLLVMGAIAVGKWMGPIRISTTEPPPPPVLALLGGVMFAIVTSLVLGIIAIVRSRGVLRRIHDEPGAWYGAGRARAALVLGWCVVLAPVVFFVQRAVR